MTWREAWRKRAFRIELSLTVILLAILAFTIGHFFQFIQGREGNSWRDPILDSIHPVDVSSWIFGVLYASMGIALWLAIRSPLLTLKLLQSYLLLVVLRVVAMWLVPLEPDPKMVLLVDPVVDRFFYSNQVITKDLFFSGHVSVMSLLAWSMPAKGVRVGLLLATAIVALLLMIQHVHFTIDVVVAPIFAWAAWRAVNGWHNRLQTIDQPL